MKNPRNYTGLLLLLFAFLSCKKEQTAVVGNASLTIINTISDGSSLVTNFNSNVPLTAFTKSAYIPANSYSEFGGLSGDVPLALFNSKDSVTSIYQHTLNLTPFNAYSLFITGDPTSPDSLFTRDQIPVFSLADSLLAIRFINLNKAGKPVTVTVNGNLLTKNGATLPYLSVTDFVSIGSSLKAAPSGYLVEFKDAATSRLLASYSLNQTLELQYKSLTLGLTSNSGSPGVLRINNY